MAVSARGRVGRWPSKARGGGTGGARGGGGTADQSTSLSVTKEEQLTMGYQYEQRNSKKTKLLNLAFECGTRRVMLKREVPLHTL